MAGSSRSVRHLAPASFGAATFISFGIVDNEVRALIVRQLGAALAAAWRRQHDQVATTSHLPHRPTNDERPEPFAAVAGRDARGLGGREQHESTIRT